MNKTTRSHSMLMVVLFVSLSACAQHKFVDAEAVIREAVNNFEAQQDSGLVQKEEVLEQEGFCADDIYTTYLRNTYLSFNTNGTSKERSAKKALAFAVSMLSPRHEDYFGAIPIVTTPEVEAWISYFKGNGRDSFVKWLIRGERLRHVLAPLLHSASMPEELYYVSMIESGFSPRAVSKANATGPWQFVRKTAKMYGLKINQWVDERRDPIKSTLAAARYLKDLYIKFGDWHLALAAYNAGPGKIRRLLKRHGAMSFWDLAAAKHIGKETRHYVPKMLAALILGAQQKEHGFEIAANVEEKLPVTTMRVAGMLRLADIARTLRIDERVLRNWNPELIKGVTPPAHLLAEGGYPLRIPQEHFSSLSAHLSAN